ncbi:imm11 family protein [Cupriavidus sp. 8B]
MSDSKIFYKVGLDFNDADQWYLDQPRDDGGNELVSGTFWQGRLWDTSIPLRTVVRKAGHPVNFSNCGHSEYVVSKTLMEVLRAALPAGQLQGIPIEIDGVGEPFEVLNVLDIIDCVDESKSDFTCWTVEDGRPDKVGDYCMNVLRVNADKVAGHELFRVKGRQIALVCSQRIRDLLVEHGVTGIRFTPVS